MAKKLLPQLFAFLVFFALGFLASSFVKSLSSSSSNPSSEPLTSTNLDNQADSQLASGNLIPLSIQNNSTPSPTSSSPKTGKYIIVASTPLVADQTQVETGEQINFSITLKNEGLKKKFLTHICFNHSGGQTFGCLLNKNLFPNESFNLNNGMIFTSPGRYTVSATLSQDGVNFFPPLNANTVTVTVL